MISGQKRQAIEKFMSVCDTHGLSKEKKAIVQVLKLVRAPATLAQYVSAERGRKETASQLGLSPEDGWTLVFHLLKKGAFSSSLVRGHAAAFSFFVGKPAADEQFIIDALESAATRGSPEKEKEVVQFEDVAKILAAASSSDSPKVRRAGVMVLLLYGAQLRVSELLALDRRHLVTDGEITTIVIQKSKNDQKALGRKTCIEVKDESISGILWHEHLRLCEEGPLFTTGPAKRCSYSTAVRDIRFLASLAGLTIKGTHGFRRGATTDCVAKGVPLHQVQIRGRWNHAASLRPYIKDTLSTQGGCNELP